MAGQLKTLREDYAEMVFVSFPGDEKSSGGCLLFEQREQIEAIIKGK